MSRLQDIDGKNSSKRVMGYRLLHIGIALALITYVLSIALSIYNYTIPHVAVLMIELFFGSGAGILGIGVPLERIFSKHKEGKKC